MCTRFASQIPVAVALFALGSVAAAQIEVGEILGGFDRPLNGAVVLLSDLDGDGVRDLALGSPNADLGFGPNAGLVRSFRERPARSWERFTVEAPTTISAIPWCVWTT